MIEVAITSPSVFTPHLMVSEIAKYIARGRVLFYKNYIVYQVLLLYTFWFLRYLNVMYCLRLFFTRTTLFTTMFTVIIVMCSLKSMCIPSFACCELHGHLCPYRHILPKAVYCCLTKNTLFTNLFTCFFMIRVIGCCHVTKFRYSTPSGF